MPYYTIILLLFCCTSLWAQEEVYDDKRLQEIFEKTAPVKDTFCIELPFEYKKQIIVSATINKETIIAKSIFPKIKNQISKNYRFP